MDTKSVDTKSDIEILKTEFNELKDSVVKLTIAVDKITIICSRMDEHINFVEDTYINLKTPINYAKNTIEKIMGYDNKLLK